ncbi:hypothetical protein Zmor_010886 [Zophobas morio]|uniref:Uncharacterized protein n=1 Tax=Zophobas morio TaxID=2755281 RepID=A0AA38MKF0_9CUCU|nr:hypothetical protein Zmor_010886 [Zophobas morio]
MPVVAGEETCCCGFMPVVAGEEIPVVAGMCLLLRVCACCCGYGADINPDVCGQRTSIKVDTSCGYSLGVTAPFGTKPGIVAGAGCVARPSPSPLVDSVLYPTTV